jgi:GWxTD domain-containing protein
VRRLAVFPLLLGSVVGCAGRPPAGAGTDGRVSPAGVLDQVADVSSSYRRLGRLTSTGSLPFIGTVAFAGAPHDSVFGVIALSLENRALAFQRESGTFVARYRVSLSVEPRQGQPVDLTREEVVRVATFPETQRADESVLFQQSVRLVPGVYRVAVTVRDLSSTSEGRAEQEFTAPAFGPGSTTAPILVYEGKERGTPADPLSLVLNPRGAIAYGADTLVAYVEGYGFAGPTTVPFEVRDEEQKVVFRDSLRFRGGQPLEGHLLRVAPDSVALGELKLIVGQASGERSSTALVSFSQAWIATNYEEVIDMLRYFGDGKRVGTLRKASKAERSRAWRDFYRDTDPDPSTPENEALSEYFGRVATANRLFIDEGALGWQTDRGEVFINLGAPDETAETTPGRARIVRWNYMNYRLTLFFQEENGFGRLRLTPGSRSDYERAVIRLRRQRGR